MTEPADHDDPQRAGTKTGTTTTGMPNSARSEALHERALAYLPGGVTGDGRHDSPYPLVFVRGRGKHLEDVDGNRYLDYHGGFGTAVLGYAHAEVDAAVARGMRETGAFVGLSHIHEIELAERLCGLLPGADRVAFCGGGGSDAMYHAVRVARAVTGRPKIVKMEGGYQGWHSDVAVSVRPPLREAGSSERPHPVPLSAGSLPAVTDAVLVAGVNDHRRLEQLFRDSGSEIAALVIEPVLYSLGCVLVEKSYLELARDLCNRHQAILIFDEVMTGFRTALSGAGSLLGVVPDLGVYGKAVANGYIMSLLAGRRHVVDHLTPAGDVFYSGTFNGHPLSVLAAQATLDVLERDEVPVRTTRLTERLREGVNEIISALRLRAVCQSFGSVWSVYFGTRAVRNYRDVATTWSPDIDRLNAEFRHFLRARQIYLHRRHVNRAFVSAQHEESDIDMTVEAVGDFLRTHAGHLR